jgi:thiol:disulfide interchange protein
MRAYLLSLFLPFIAQAQLDAFSEALGARSKESSQSALISEWKSVAPGQTFDVAIALKHPPGWHSYYLNPGGIEDSLTVKWILPQGATTGPIQWPAPHITEPVFQFNEKLPEKAYTYSDDQAFFITSITLPNDTALVGSTIKISANAKWQICKEQCIDEEATLALELPVVATGEKNRATEAAFAKARDEHPQPNDWTFRVEKNGTALQLRVRGAPRLDNAHFIADQKMIVPLSSMNARQEGGDFIIDLTTRKKLVSGIDIVPATELSGILRFHDGTAERAVLVPTTVITRAPSPPLPLAKYLPILLGMFLGGLILNLMPCVFPVIGIKILGFVQQAGQDKRKIILHGLSFTIGVLVSFWILCGILAYVRQSISGAEFGWGFQLQNPLFVLALMMLMFIMALNLSGVFEIGTSATGIGGNLQSKQGLSGTFFSGFLATVVATPCSGPFLGPAIGAAIVLPPPQFFIAFTAMALGLSLPYLIMSIFPKLVDYLPRPGSWMETFKQGMAFLLFATAGYLLWVYTGLIDLENMLNPVFGLTAVALAGWIYGRWNTYAHSARTRAIATSLAALLLV